MSLSKAGIDVGSSGGGTWISYDSGTKIPHW